MENEQKDLDSWEAWYSCLCCIGILIIVTIILYIWVNFDNYIMMITIGSILLGVFVMVIIDYGLFQIWYNLKTKKNKAI